MCSLDGLEGITLVGLPKTPHSQKNSEKRKNRGGERMEEKRPQGASLWLVASHQFYTRQSG